MATQARPQQGSLKSKTERQGLVAQCGFDRVLWVEQYRRTAGVPSAAGFAKVSGRIAPNAKGSLKTPNPVFRLPFIPVHPALRRAHPICTAIATPMHT
ncbi:MAG: hypothetical protein D8B42_07320, partial [Kingella sp. (in: b-proteobacteria)]